MHTISSSLKRNKRELLVDYTRKAFCRNLCTDNKFRNISIIGVGGVGGYYGSKLAFAYTASKLHKINFVARGEHFEKIKSDGLELITTTEKYIVRPTRIVQDIAILPKQDLIILAIKFYDLNNIISRLKDIIHQDTYILPLLNGVNIKDYLASSFPANRVIEGCVYISSHLISPGVVKQSGGSCELLFGSASVDKNKLNEVKEIFNNAKIIASINENMPSIIWQKYLFVCPMSCMIVAYSVNKSTILDSDKLSRELRYLMQEIATIALKNGIILPLDIVERTIDRIKKTAPSTIPSMQWDYEHHKPLEIEIFPGYIINKAKLFSIEVPYHQTIYDKLKEKNSINEAYHKKFK